VFGSYRKGRGVQWKKLISFEGVFVHLLYKKRQPLTNAMSFLWLFQ